jgi:hypothetical protein
MQEFSGYEYILIDIANQYGKDKLLWEERIEWTLSNFDVLEDMIDSAKKPYLFAKAINALNTVHADKQTNHLIGLDACASGISIMGLLIGCRKTLEQTNLINTGKVQDPYTNVTVELNRLLGSEIEYDREDIKYVLMPLGYGSKASPKLFFGENTPELKAFYKARQNLLPGTIIVSDDIRSLWNSNSPEYTWTLPNGHTAKCMVKDQEPTKLRIHEVYGMGITFTYQYTKIGICSNYDTPIIANIIQSIDAYVCQEMIGRCHKDGFHILTIHDAMYCHVNNANKMRRNYLQICYEICKSNLLQDIATQLLGYEVEVEKMEYGLEDLILEADYPIC